MWDTAARERRMLVVLRKPTVLYCSLCSMALFVKGCTSHCKHCCLCIHLKTWKALFSFVLTCYHSSSEGKPLKMKMDVEVYLNPYINLHLCTCIENVYQKMLIIIGSSVLVVPCCFLQHWVWKSNRRDQWKTPAIFTVFLDNTSDVGCWVADCFVRMWFVLSKLSPIETMDSVFIQEQNRTNQTKQAPNSNETIITNATKKNPAEVYHIKEYVK